MTRSNQSPKQAAYLFFLRNAGYSVAQGESKQAGRSRCARELAKAERDARALGLTFEWQDDPDGYDVQAHEENVQTCEMCVCLDSEVDPDDDRNRHILASLGAIWDATREYRRVVEAELAAEALAALAKQ